MSFGRTRRRVRLAELSLTPLIDVVLNLLVFFMLSANFSAHASLEVKLPPADVPPSLASPQDLVVTITAEGRFLVGGVEHDADQLRARLRNVRAKAPRGTLVLEADAEAAHRHLVAVMALAREAGFSDVGIAVEPRRESRSR